MGVAGIQVDKKRMRFVAASVILMLLFVLGIRSMLDSDGAYVPEDRLHSMNDERSQVFVGGSRYELDVETKEEHKEQQEKRREIIRERERTHQQTAAQKRMSETREEPKLSEQNTKTTSEKKSDNKNKRGSSVTSGKNGNKGNGKNGVTPKRPTENRQTRPRQNPQSQKGKKAEAPPKKEKPKPKAKEPEKKKKNPKETAPSDKENKLPVIKTSLVDGRSLKGTSVSFWVSVKDYRNQVVPVFSNDDGSFSVYVNGEQISSSGTSGEKTNFRSEVIDGVNEVMIVATDRLGKEATKILSIRCDTAEQAKPVGTVYVNAYAPSLGIGTIFEGISVDITEQENLHDVFVDAFKKAGVTADMSSNYIAAIKKSGIAADAVISDEIREKAEEQRVTLIEREDWPDGWKNRLREKDFCSHSGWIYTVNGTAPAIGINAFIPSDGDDISLIFILFEGDMD